MRKVEAAGLNALSLLDAATVTAVANKVGKKRKRREVRQIRAADSIRLAVLHAIPKNGDARGKERRDCDGFGCLHCKSRWLLRVRERERREEMWEVGEMEWGWGWLRFFWER